jgi:membrane-bound inhibitor of C-type lysozyme
MTPRANPRERNRFGRTATLALAMVFLPLFGCGSIDLWPFGDSKSQELSRKPVGATEYQCNNDRRLYVRYLDNGASAWVIFPEREFRLDKVASASGTRYSNGIAMLEKDGDDISLRDGPTVAFTGCKPAGDAKSGSR